MRHTFSAPLVGGAVLLGALGTGAVAHAIESRTQDAAGTAKVQDCRGGAQEFTQMRTNDASTARGEGGFAPIPNAGTGFNVPAGDSDLVVVRLSGETELSGAGLDDNLMVRVILDGVPMDPIGPNSFSSFNSPSNHAQSWCRRVGPGAHSVRAEWALLDSGGNNVVTAALDDWALEVELSN